MVHDLDYEIGEVNTRIPPQVAERLTPTAIVESSAPPTITSITGENLISTEFIPLSERIQARSIAALEQELSVLKEQMWSGGIAYDPDMYLSPAGGGSLFYNRLSQSQRELNPIQQARALELAFLLYESNPLGKAIVETTRDFILGNSVGAGSTDPDDDRRKEQQQVIDEFWSDFVNLVDIKLHDKVLELGLYGEQCWPVTVNPVDGHVQLGYIDPGTIQRIVTNPKNVEEQIAVVTYLKKPNATGADEEVWYKIIAPDTTPNSKWFGRLRGVDVNRRGVPLPGADTVSWTNVDGTTGSHKVEGACFFFTVNKVSNATRGRSDLLSLIDWIDAYDQLLFGEVDRGLLLKAFIWDVNLEGYTDSQITEYKKANPQPKPASVRYHNEKVEWKAVTPDLKAGDSAAGADLILSYIATGARLPKTWLNGMMDVNKASAQELGAPALARLSLRQNLVKYIITYILTFVLDQAEMRGIIAKRPKVMGSQRPAAWPLQINLPDLQQINQITVATILGNIVAALVAAMQNELVDKDLAQETLVMFVKQMGIEVNLTALRARLEENPYEPPAGLLAAGGERNITKSTERAPLSGTINPAKEPGAFDTKQLLKQVAPQTHNVA